MPLPSCLALCRVIAHVQSLNIKRKSYEYQIFIGSIGNRIHSEQCI